MFTKTRKANYDDLLQKDNFLGTHHRNLHISATEIFNLKNDLAPNIMEEVFQFREPLYKLRSEMRTFMTLKVRIMYRSLNSDTYLAPRILQLVPEATLSVKKTRSFNHF